MDGPYASLAMYPIVAPGWARLWAGVADLVGWAPREVLVDGDVHRHWADPACHVAHTCGWPLTTALLDHAVVGAFRFGVPGAEGHRYRSVLVARRARPLDELAAGPVAANSPDSLSGWISVLVACGRAPADVRWTGSHVASIAAVVGGEAELASIDALTMALLRRSSPASLDGLVEVGQGPLVPGPPLVVPGATTTERIEELRAAVATVLAGDSPLRAELLVDGFAALDRADYAGLSDLATSAPHR